MRMRLKDARISQGTPRSAGQHQEPAEASKDSLRAEGVAGQGLELRLLASKTKRTHFCCFKPLSDRNIGPLWVLLRPKSLGDFIVIQMTN